MIIMSKYRVEHLGKTLSTSLPQAYCFLSSSTLSNPSFSLYLLLSSDLSFLHLPSLPWLNCRLLFCRHIINVRISTFIGNALKAATISISYKSSYSTPSLPFDDAHSPLRTTESLPFATQSLLTLEPPDLPEFRPTPQRSPVPRSWPSHLRCSSVAACLSLCLRAVGHGHSHSHNRGASEVDSTQGFCTGAAGPIE
jgi:hypothetical protein